MTQSVEPFLVRFSSAPTLNPQTPALELDPVTGLFRRPGSPTPFVEELFAKGDFPYLVAASMATAVTEGTGDSPDPDLIRADFQTDAMNLFLGTALTRAQPDQPDPDLVRAEQM
jgi:hypothetical protein